MRKPLWITDLVGQNGWNLLFYLYIGKNEYGQSFSYFSRFIFLIDCISDDKAIAGYLCYNFKNEESFSTFDSSCFATFVLWDA